MVTDTEGFSKKITANFCQNFVHVTPFLRLVANQTRKRGLVYPVDLSNGVQDIRVVRARTTSPGEGLRV
jgi:hypothetical protein